jgi:hypothetical protein
MDGSTKAFHHDGFLCPRLPPNTAEFVNLQQAYGFKCGSQCGTGRWNKLRQPEVLEAGSTLLRVALVGDFLTETRHMDDDSAPSPHSRIALHHHQHPCYVPRQASSVAALDFKWDTQNERADRLRHVEAETFPSVVAVS